MAVISDPQLSIQVDRTAKTATLRVTCALEFTAFEVRSMNVIGLHFTLECQLLGMQSRNGDAVIAFAPKQFPRIRDGATQFEFPVFEAVAAARDLEPYNFGKDALVAELRLSNEDPGDRECQAHTAVPGGPGGTA